MDDPLRDGIRSAWEKELFVDYKIHVEDKEFHVHRIIMSSMSDYFQAMLSGGMAESERDSVTIEGVQASTVETLIKFIYTNRLDITKENVTEILNGAMYFQIKSAIEMCTLFMVENLNEENCLEILALFKYYSLTKSFEDTEKHAKEFLIQLIKKGNNSDLPYEDFEILVKIWDRSEMELFRFILKWVKSDEKERKKHFDDLLLSVRFPLMTQNQLSELGEISLGNISSKTLHVHIKKALGYQKLPIHQRVLDDSLETKVRGSETFVSFAYETGAFYDPHEKCFVKHGGFVLQGNDSNLAYKSVVVNNFLVVPHHIEDMGSIWTIFDPRTNQWEEIANGPSPEHVMANNTKYLYAFSENPPDDWTLYEVVRFSFQAGKWSHFQSMTPQAHTFAACIFKNRLYMTGGDTSYDLERQKLAKMDCLDLNSRKWESKAPMLKQRSEHFMTQVTLFGEEVLCIIDKGWSVDYYSTLTDQWSTCTFIFSQIPPAFEPLLFGGPLRNGNSLFILADDMDGIAKVNFPEEGNEASVEYVYEDPKQFILQPCIETCALLAVNGPSSVEIL